MRSVVVRGLVLVALVACSAPRAWTQEAYVWQRQWSDPVRAAVAHPPAALTGLRVLVAEPELLAVDRHALAAAARPVTLVVRLDGTRPLAEYSLAPIVALAREVGAAGIEIDHDCATAHLADYAAWLVAHRPPHDLRFSITALPTWASSAALADVAAAVDELVVQVHAVRAPAIFEPGTALTEIARFAAAVPSARLRVALPTYRAFVGGAWREADAGDVAGFVDELHRLALPNVTGIVWFRLPVAGDPDTWSDAVFASVLERRPRPPSAVTVTLRPRGDDGYDIVASNPTTAPLDLPGVRLGGGIADAELVGGYERHGQRFRPPHRRIAGGTTQTIGWVRGKVPHVAVD